VQTFVPTAHDCEIPGIADTVAAAAVQVLANFAANA